MKNGSSKSCGCWKREVNIEKIKQYNKDMDYEEHPNGINKRLYEIWIGMKKRCYNENHERYRDYGGRGIKVCNEWLHSYNTFESWALLHGYSDELTIDRVDNDGNYEPDNCRWSTYKEQATNSRHNRFITLNGETHTISQWCEIRNLHYGDVTSRLSRGWSEESALSSTYAGFDSEYYKYGRR